jgi:hypothetical protein
MLGNETTLFPEDHSRVRVGGQRNARARADGHDSPPLLGPSGSARSRIGVRTRPAQAPNFGLQLHCEAIEQTKRRHGRAVLDALEVRRLNGARLRQRGLRQSACIPEPPDVRSDRDR